MDKRALIVELTEKGETFHLQKPDYAELFTDLTAKERTGLQKILDKVIHQLEVQIQKETVEEEEEFFY